MKVSINSKIVNNVCSTNRKAINEAFKQFNGKEIILTIERKKKKRSNEQNRYLFGVIYPIVKLAFKESWGEVRSIEEIHEWAKNQFNYIEKVNEETGEIMRLPKSTTLNSTTDQEVFHEEIRRFCDEWFGVSIPLPNEQVEIKL
jgi:hypothetical protein